MKQLKVANAIACEYVALGAHGKHTLINVYSGDIQVPHFPALIPMAFYIEIVPDKSIPKSLILRLLGNDRVHATVAAASEYHEGRVGLIVIPQMPWTITEDTEIKVVLSGEGLRTTTLKKLKVSVGPVSEG